MHVLEEVMIPAAPSEGFSRFQEFISPAQDPAFLFGEPRVGKDIEQVTCDEKGIVVWGFLQEPEQLGPVAVKVGGEEEAHGKLRTALRSSGLSG
jgi:hypothetical protein